MLDGCSPASPPSLRAHCGLRPDQPHAGAVGVEVHGVVGAEQGLDVGAGEELRRGVRAFGHRELPALPDAGLLVDGRSGTDGALSGPDGACRSAGRRRAVAAPRDRRTRRA